MLIYLYEEFSEECAFGWPGKQEDWILHIHE